jgi:hypothetical protein
MHEEPTLPKHPHQLELRILIKNQKATKQFAYQTRKYYKPAKGNINEFKWCYCDKS